MKPSYIPPGSIAPGLGLTPPFPGSSADPAGPSRWYLAGLWASVQMNVKQVKLKLWGPSLAQPPSKASQPLILYS